jgi:hypothetical protein
MFYCSIINCCVILFIVKKIGKPFLGKRTHLLWLCYLKFADKYDFINEPTLYLGHFFVEQPVQRYSFASRYQIILTSILGYSSLSVIISVYGFFFFFCTIFVHVYFMLFCCCPCTAFLFLTLYNDV